MSRTARVRRCTRKHHRVLDKFQAVDLATGRKVSFVEALALSPNSRRLLNRWWTKESKSNRARWQRAHRANVRGALQRGDWEGVPAYRPSGGWITW